MCRYCDESPPTQQKASKPAACPFVIALQLTFIATVCGALIISIFDSVPFYYTIPIGSGVYVIEVLALFGMFSERSAGKRLPQIPLQQPNYLPSRNPQMLPPPGEASDFVTVYQEKLPDGQVIYRPR